MEPRVLVTGASGFIATHIVHQLQKQGYKVRGTVRSLNNENKIKPLRQLCPDAKHELELVEADLLNEESWKDAVKDCEYVLHVASPFPAANPAHEDELIVPAVNGTLNVLKAVAAEGVARRVVLTSSSAAVSNGVEGNASHTAGTPYTEADWTDVDTVSAPYFKSKTLAEKAAWDFVRDKKFELAVVNPVYVMGPVLCGSDFTSLEIPRRLLQHAMPALPKLNLPIIDVRDVAAAHIAAMTEPGAAGNRHILSAGNLWVREMALIIAGEFKSQGYSIPTYNLPNFAVKLAGIFDKSLRMITPSLSKVSEMSNDRMRNILKIEPRDMKETVIDMCYSMIDRDFVKKTSKYRGRPDKNKDGTEL